MKTRFGYTHFLGCWSAWKNLSHPQKLNTQFFKNLGFFIGMVGQHDLPGLCTDSDKEGGVCQTPSNRARWGPRPRDNLPHLIEARAMGFCKWTSPAHPVGGYKFPREYSQDKGRGAGDYQDGFQMGFRWFQMGSKI